MAEVAPELEAFEALAKSERLADLVALARVIIGGAVEARRADFADPEKFAKGVEDAKLEASDFETPYGNALRILERGPEDDAERALASAIWAHVMAEAPPQETSSFRENRGDADRMASDLLWLAAFTPFDATPLIDRALGEHAPDLWRAIANRVRRAGERRNEGRLEGLVGAASLACAKSSVAVTEAKKLAGELKDPTLARILGSGDRAELSEERIEGELVSPPRGPALTTALALSGILLLSHAIRALLRLALAYKRPAEVVLTTASIRIRARTEVLGRTVRERELVIPRSGLSRATREVRYPRAPFYAGLGALAIGSFLGVSMFTDGVRSASPSMLAWGLGVIAVGIAVDFGLQSLLPGARGRCRIAFQPKEGRAVCVGSVDIKRADRALAKLA